MLSFSVNWLAVIVALVVNMVLGAIWYGVFANPWMAAIGKTREEIEQSQGAPAFAVAGLNSLLMAFVLTNVIGWMGAVGLVGGALAGLIMWLGFTGFTIAGNLAFAGRSLNLWLIDAGYYLVGLIVMGAILGVWR